MLSSAFMSASCSSHEKRPLQEATTTTAATFRRPKRVSLDQRQSFDHHQQQKRKINTHQNPKLAYKDTDVDNEIDDEIEFLYIIPSPPKLVTVSPKEGIPSKKLARLTNIKDHVKSASSPSLLSLSQLPICSFSHQSSAYLQSVAEICHAILHDIRWRVTEGSGHLNRLFTWEQGDDLSVIHTLARRYVCPHHENGSTCQSSYFGTPVLERNGVLKQIENDNEIEESYNEIKDHNDQELNEKELQRDRCLEVYTRLYFRCVLRISMVSSKFILC